MSGKFHAGERAVQAQAGVTAMAQRLENGIHDTLPPAAQEFMAQQPFAILSMADRDGAVWASLLAGKPGILRAVDARRVRVDALPVPGDPARTALDETLVNQTTQAGLLVIEPATRRRMRVNGILEAASAAEPNGFTLRVEQAYANCPKYIQARSLTSFASNSPNSDRVHAGTLLTQAQQAWIGGADTFFIATAHPARGADASHRGGNPGFVHVLNAQTLAFPDYAGNNMFNTLGNLTINPRAGLLFLNFATGDTLQLTGEALVCWEPEAAAEFAGAQRVVTFHIERVVAIERAIPLRWQFAGFSPFNPG